MILVLVLESVVLQVERFGSSSDESESENMSSNTTSTSKSDVASLDLRGVHVREN